MNIEEMEVEVNELYHAGYISNEEYDEIIGCLDEDEDEMVLQQIEAAIASYRHRVY